MRLLWTLIVMASLADMMMPAVAGGQNGIPAGPPLMDPMAGGRFTKDEQELVNKLDSLDQQLKDGKINDKEYWSMSTPIRQEFLKKVDRFGPDAPRPKMK